MNVEALDFELPERLIAQKPVPQRDHSRLLVVDRRTDTLSHHQFFELPDLIPEKSWFFRNVASVFKARLLCRRPTGGKVECLLLNPAPTLHSDGEAWECLIRPARKLPPGSRFSIPGELEAEVREKAENGVHSVVFRTRAPGLSLVELAERLGSVPLPPYIQRDETLGPDSRDAHDYQTVYADPGKKVAAAAPTAGLHFTQPLLQKLEAQNHRFFNLTLHVGLGTFQPIKSRQVEAHPMHREWYEIPADTREALHQAPTRGIKRCAVGTTAVRAVEDYFRTEPQPAPLSFSKQAGLFLTPPASFFGTDALITNFHLPRSSLLCMVGAFLTPNREEGLSWLKEIYGEAIALGYRFFSYGDAMLIL